MAERFAGKVVMITGAGGGFGRRAAERFSEEGAYVVLSDLDKRALDDTAKVISCSKSVITQPIDVTDENAVLAHIEHASVELGPIDIAINNAGIGQVLTPLHKTSVADFDRILAVNAKGVFTCMKAQLPGMIARQAGVILNVASAAGLVGAGQIAAYAASKHAVVGLTRSAADEVARYGIRVNALCPSFAPTPLFDEIANDMARTGGLSRDQADQRITGRIPMRRLATIEEVVQAMLWACDPGNSFMTGQAIAIDGGLTAV